MRISEQWLRSWINPPCPIDKIGEKLTQAGFEIEAITQLSPDFKAVKVGFVTQCSPHPNAEKLKVARVDIGQGDPLQIVCGAANCRSGIYVACAVVGATLPNNFKIASRTLRGLVSEGMLCSAEELQLTAMNQSEGILELEGQPIVGTPLDEHLGLVDQVMTLSVPTNRGDCLSLMGLTRELQLAYPDVISDTARTLYAENAAALPSALVPKDPLHVVERFDLCPLYCSARIDGVNLAKPTPTWIQKVLTSAGLQTVNVLVDILNYVMLELGQPMHGFDYDLVQGPLRIREAKALEKVALLNGQEVVFSGSELLIADGLGPLVLAGAMGGSRAKVTENSTHILLEAAYFSPSCVSGGARLHKVLTESAIRFERGVDYARTDTALARAIDLIKQYCGYTDLVLHTSCEPTYLPKVPSISFNKLNIPGFLGIALSDESAARMLQSLGCQIRTPMHETAWTVVAPTWRVDLQIERDLLEEIARLEGFEKIAGSRPYAQLDGRSVPKPSAALQLPAKQRLASLGFNEAITYSFVDPEHQACLFPNEDSIQLPNPISNALSVMRISLLPGLLDALKYNQARQASDIKLFELGRIFKPMADHRQGIAEESLLLSGVAWSAKGNQNWDQSLLTPCDFFYIKGVCQTFLSQFLSPSKAARCQFEPSVSPHWHPHRAASITLQGDLLGCVGQLHPTIANQLGLQGEIFCFELVWGAILQHLSINALSQPSKYPSTYRDVCLALSDPKITWYQLVKEAYLALDCDPEIKVEVSLHDVYTTDKTHSLTLRVHLEPQNRTLNEVEIQNKLQKLLDSLANTCSAKLRTA